MGKRPLELRHITFYMRNENVSRCAAALTHPDNIFRQSVISLQNPRIMKRQRYPSSFMRLTDKPLIFLPADTDADGNIFIHVVTEIAFVSRNTIGIIAHLKIKNR